MSELVPSVRFERAFRRLVRKNPALRFQQAAKVHLEALLQTGRPIPEAFRDKFVLAPDLWINIRFRTAASLNAACARLAANSSAQPAATGTIQIHSEPTAK
jgi:hypothetical protein